MFHRDHFSRGVPEVSEQTCSCSWSILLNSLFQYICSLGDSTCLGSPGYGFQPQYSCKKGYRERLETFVLFIGNLYILALPIRLPTSYGLAGFLDRRQHGII